MKQDDWYRTLGMADDKYVVEAHPARTLAPTQKHRMRRSLLAACACLALVLGNLWLFLPYSTTPPDVSRYEGSEYYDVIEQLNLLTFQKPKYKNNATMLLSELKSSISIGDLASGGAAAPGENMAQNNAGSYEEITDNQVAGIIEADRIKRSDTHIYYLDQNVLRVFSIEKEETKEVGSYTLHDGTQTYFQDLWEFYLSADCKTVTVITQCYDFTKKGSADRYVNLVSLDVSDPANITKKSECSITGMYMSSRLINGSILLLSEFTISKGTLDFSDESTFLPQIDEGEGAYSIPRDCIASPETLNSTRYTVVMKLSESTLELCGTAAYLSYSEDVYVSEDHVFLTHVYADKAENADGTITRNSMTTISCLDYSTDTFETKGSVTVRGYVKDQWSMDEYEGILRVFTTTNATTVQQTTSGMTVSSTILQTATGQSNASLYCIDLTTFEIVASVIDFAPPREEVQSVRFDGTTAYVCTSIELSDPVFFFDLSDLTNVTYKDTGTIEGFSTSLINLGDGYLLGIGRGSSWSTLKIEIYEETEDGVRSVDAYEMKDATYSTEYKSYYVNREHQLIGLGVVDYTYDKNGKYDDTTFRYILLHFDGYELVELVNAPLDGDPVTMRGVYIDGYMYMFGEDDFAVEKVFD